VRSRTVNADRHAHAVVQPQQNKGKRLKASSEANARGSRAVLLEGKQAAQQVWEMLIYASRSAGRSECACTGARRMPDRQFFLKMRSAARQCVAPQQNRRVSTTPRRYPRQQTAIARVLNKFHAL